MDKKINQLIFVGYYEDMKAYHVVEINTHDVFFHIYIQFDKYI